MRKLYLYLVAFRTLHSLLVLFLVIIILVIFIFADTGKLWTVGAGKHGQLGLGSFYDESIPKLVCVIFF